MAKPCRDARPGVLMVGMDLTRTRGGITTLTRDILASSVAKDFRITYIASQAEDFGTVRKGMLAVRAFADFFVKCITDDHDLVYVHVGSNASLYRESAFMVAARVLGKQVLGHFHAGDIQEYFQHRSKLGQWMIRFGLRSAGRWIAVSSESAKMLKSVSGSNEVLVIENAIDMSEFAQTGTRSDGNQVRLLFVGAVGKLKGEQDLLKALAIVKDRGYRFLVSFVGYGADSMADEIAALDLSERVEHLGPVATSERIAHFQKADIFVLPTYAEAMPVSVIEAMAAGNAVITTPVGGIPEIADDGETALLFSPGNVDQLVARIIDLLDDSELRRRLGANARKKALREFDMRSYERRLSVEVERAMSMLPRTKVPLKLVAKRAVKSSAAYASRLRSRQIAAGVRVLAYHRVVADISTAERNAYYGLVVSTDTFRRHCEILANEYDVMSLESAANALESGKMGERPIAVITFDDGYKDNLEEAFPVLKEMGLPGTVFLPTGFIGRGSPLAHDRLFWLLTVAEKRGLSLDKPVSAAGLGADLANRFRVVKNSLALTEALVYLPHLTREHLISELENAIGDRPPYPSEFDLLDWNMAREMLSGGISFGGHSVNHAVLTLENPEAARIEIEQSLMDLKRELGVECRTFAYPNGACDANIKSVAASLGVSVAVTTERGVNRPDIDLLSLRRTSLCEESTRGLLGSYSPQVARLRLAS